MHIFFSSQFLFWPIYILLRFISTAEAVTARGFFAHSPPFCVDVFFSLWAPKKTCCRPKFVYIVYIYLVFADAFAVHPVALTGHLIIETEFPRDVNLHVLEAPLHQKVLYKTKRTTSERKKNVISMIVFHNK